MNAETLAKNTMQKLQSCLHWKFTISTHRSQSVDRKSIKREQGCTSKCQQNTERNISRTFLQNIADISAQQTYRTIKKRITFSHRDTRTHIMMAYNNQQYYDERAIDQRINIVVNSASCVGRKYVAAVPARCPSNAAPRRVPALPRFSRAIWHQGALVSSRRLHPGTTTVAMVTTCAAAEADRDPVDSTDITMHSKLVATFLVLTGYTVPTKSIHCS